MGSQIVPVVEGLDLKSDENLPDVTVEPQTTSSEHFLHEAQSYFTKN